MKKILALGMIASLQFLLTGCGDDPLDQYGYQYQGAYCVSRYNGQAVDASKCGPYTANNGVNPGYAAPGYVAPGYANNTYAGTTYNGYYLNGANCIAPTGQVVAITYCQNSTTVLGGATVAQQCVGNYYLQGGFGGTPIACSGVNCRGQILMTLQGQTVQCQ